MVTLDVSGIVSWGYDFDGDYAQISLVQKDGLRIDLISRFQEIIKSFGKMMQINIWTADSFKSKDELKRQLIEYLYCDDVEAKYESTSYFYSSYTCGTDYESVLKIGGHDLFKIIQQKDGQFIWIEINIKNQNEQ